MSRRRAALAVSVFSLFALSVVAVVTPVRAQTDVEDARRQAERAAGATEGAYQIVDEAVAERAAVEDRLFEALDRYQANAELFAEISASLESLNDTLAVAEAREESTRDSFETQAVAAYIEAVGAAGVLVFDSTSLESAMVTQETLGRSTRETLASLDGFLAFQNEVDSLRASTIQRSDETAAVQQTLEADAAELEELFAAANEEVATAYQLALAAEAELAQAREALATAERAATTTAPPATSATTTAPPTTTTPGSSTSTSVAATSTSTTTEPPSTTTTSQPATTSTTAPESWPPIPINSATNSWRPLLGAHFAPDLVLDALVIIQCESLGNPDAVNPYSGASGLFQFMPGTWAVASVESGVGSRSVFDGEANIIAASWLAEYYRSRGLDPWRPWACRSLL
jgi:soluble lytic murein transglycosylase-like protein